MEKGNNRYKKMTPVVFILFLAVLAGIGFMKLHCKEKEETDYVRKNWVEVSAKVNRVMRSGNRHKQTTLLQVELTYENEKQRATIRRGGYKENTYNEGDSIAIYINPENKTEIK